MNWQLNRTVSDPCPGVTRIIAPNPSPMTGQGTNSYVLGHDRLIVIDPGPLVASHLEALLAVIRGRPVDLILATHSHLDHTELAPALGRATGAQVAGFGDRLAGQSEVMRALSAGGLVGGGEGVDHGFAPDQTFGDGDVVPFEDGPLRVLHTPGHFGNHVCFAWADVVFSGDHVLGFSTTLISPPDGDLTEYMRSLDRIEGAGARVLLPGHGPEITQAGARIRALRAHRLMRERQIIAVLQAGPSDIRTLTEGLYADVQPALHAMASRNVFAHLIDLHGRRIVAATPALAPDATFGLGEAVVV